HRRGGESGLPGPARLAAAASRRAPRAVDLVRHDERRVIPAEVLAGGGDLLGAQRLAVDVVGALEARRALADGGAARDQARPVLALRPGERPANLAGIVAVDRPHRPAGGLEARGLVGGVGEADRAVD